MGGWGPPLRCPGCHMRGHRDGCLWRWAWIKERWNGLPRYPLPYNHTRFWDTNAYFVRDPICSTPGTESTTANTHGDLLVMGEKRSAFNFLGREVKRKKGGERVLPTQRRRDQTTLWVISLVMAARHNIIYDFFCGRSIWYMIYHIRSSSRTGETRSNNSLSLVMAGRHNILYHTYPQYDTSWLCVTYDLSLRCDATIW